MNQIADGLYSYRFKGFAQDPRSIEYFLVGVGALRVDGGHIEGEHRATYLRLSRGPFPPVDGHYKVQGEIVDWVPKTGSGSAQLTFTQLDKGPGEGQVLTGQFALVQAGPDEYWLTSYGGADVVYGGQQQAVKGTELVEGELRRISN